MMLVLSCSPDTDGDPSTVPEITAFNFAQSGDDGEQFNFTISFRDSDGNLSGEFSPLTGSEEPASIPLQHF